jgi:hypothetical protein
MIGPMKQGVLIALASVCAIGTARAQMPAAAATKPAPALPVLKIAVSEDDDYQTLPWSGQPGEYQESYCNGNGDVYVVRGGSGLVALSPKGVIPFLADKITDVPHPRTTSLGMNPSLSASGISFLATGTDDSKVETRNWTDDQGQKHVDHDLSNAILHYLVRFDADGTYRGAIKLDLPFLVYKFATFDSGAVIAQGMEKEKIPRIALLNASAEFLRYLDLPKDISTAGSTSPDDVKCNGCTADMNSVVFNTYFTPWRNEILLKREFGNGLRIYEIQESGQVRLTKVNVPEGYDIGPMVPSDRNWLVRFNKPDAGGVRPRAFDSLLEIDPQNGKPLREYHLKPPATVPETILSCFFDGEFWGIRQNQKEGRIEVVRGAAAP